MNFRSIPFIPKFTVLIIILFISAITFAQKKSAFVSGKIIDENENPIPKVSVTILGRQTGIITSDSGTFKISVPVDKAFALVFSSTGYRGEQRNFYLSDGE
ncbi:MAG: carboxypeptidase-like regulatory domain-containing protein, partial [Bacteroidota bacterium]|nr:carboxypeptidase-like regulatory domain-containing protein [Bacteroidota bacterium]